MSVVPRRIIFVERSAKEEKKTEKESIAFSMCQTIE